MDEVTMPTLFLFVCLFIETLIKKPLKKQMPLIFYFKKSDFIYPIQTNMFLAEFFEFNWIQIQFSVLLIVLLF